MEKVQTRECSQVNIDGFATASFAQTFSLRWNSLFLINSTYKTVLLEHLFDGYGPPGNRQYCFYIHDVVVTLETFSNY